MFEMNKYRINTEFNTSDVTRNKIKRKSALFLWYAEEHKCEVRLAMHSPSGQAPQEKLSHITLFGGDQ